MASKGRRGPSYVFASGSTQISNTGNANENTLVSLSIPGGTLQPGNILRVTLLKSGFGLATPVQSALSTAATGGSLAAGTYYYVITPTNATGEGLKSNEQSITTTGTTSTVTVTWNAISGATGYKIYRGTAAGGENVYYSVGAVTTFTDTGAANTAGTPPTSNTANGGTKIFKIYYGGTMFYQDFFANAQSGLSVLQVKMRTATSQVGLQTGIASGIGSGSSAITTGTVDTTVAQTLLITNQLNVSTDTAALEFYEVEIVQG